MDLKLNRQCLRVLGSLMEKSLATPDYYPMSLSGLVAACNQKSSREPVMSLTEVDVREALDALMAAHLVRERGEAGARVSKFAHRLDDELGLRFGFKRPQVAVLALLFLRGPQTAGELRTRSGRLCEFQDVAQVEQVLNALASATDGPYVQQLPREAGRREHRFVHLFGDEPIVVAAPASPSEAPTLLADVTPGAGAHRDVAAPGSTQAVDDRVTALEEALDALARRVERLEGG